MYKDSSPQVIRYRERKIVATIKIRVAAIMRKLLCLTSKYAELCELLFGKELLDAVLFTLCSCE